MIRQLERCVADYADRHAMKRLQLNADKTKLLWFGSILLLRCLSPNSKTVTAGHNIIKPSICVQNLSMLFNTELLMRKHVFSIYVIFILSVDNSAVMSQPC